MIHLAPISSAETVGSAQISSFNWGATPLGPLTRWPPALRIAVDMLLLSAYPCALVWGPALTVIHNETYPAPLGERSHAQGDSFDALWATAWDEMGAAVFQALEGQGSLAENSLLTVNRDGRPVQAWFTCSYSPIRDDQGTVVGFLHALIETTASVERTREWRELAQSFEAQLSRYMAESEHTWQLSPDVMLMLDTELRVRLANPAWHRLSGWTDGQQTPAPLLELIHPAERTETRLALMALMQGHDAPPFEARVRQGEGHYCWLRWHAVPGQALPILIGHNITEERHSVQRMAEAAVRDSQRMESVIKVAGGLAHEMNNVLSGVGSSLELLERRLAQGRLERLDSYVQVARECAQRAIGLTQNLLAFARSQPLSPNPLDINQLIRKAQPMLEQCVGAEMHLRWELDIAPWPVQLDPDQLRNALLHLCANARDACLGRGSLSIRTSNERLAGATAGLPAGDYVMVQVEDDGHGMSAEEVTRAFEPFYTTKPLGQGSGLGLPMVHGFVRQSGGQMWIESRLQHGTQIVLMFPRYSGSQPIPEPPPITRKARQGERVLLIDDELNLRGLIKEILVDRGFEVFDVTDANTALGQYRHAGPFDLVITDIGLPGGFNGRQVARAMRMINPEQKILFITGYTEDPVEQQLLDEPGTALLLKPFSLESLVIQVDRMLPA
ncbi:ATP-binding protein [Pseudomonas sichuanensis]|uniref:ATP-binding protein n=1 Tax=Pseudomonas sichuanensis TaxID=2213015 RepID=UPI000DA6B795|nr:ATP-binding protein [Pseudomonas sichuanensis]